MAYIGPERRRGDRRAPVPRVPSNLITERRQSERRQEALTAVVMGMDCRDLLQLQVCWERIERLREFNQRAG